MSQSNNLFIPAAIVIAGAMVAGAVIFTSPTVSNNQAVTAPGTNQPVAAAPTPADITFVTENFPTLGSADAPVTIVEYSDFTCPFCKRFVDETKPQIIQEYIDKGLVQFVRKDFIAVGGQAAAEAAHCAGDQNAYWQYHAELIGNQTADRGTWNNPETHRAYATRLGLNVANFMNCLEAETHVGRISESTSEAVSNGGQGTPFFIINGTPVSGAQPFAVFKQIIDAALAEA